MQLKKYLDQYFFLILIHPEFSFECLITFPGKFLFNNPQVNKHFQDNSVEIVKIYRK